MWKYFFMTDSKLFAISVVGQMNPRNILTRKNSKRQSDVFSGKVKGEVHCVFKGLKGEQHGVFIVGFRVKFYRHFGHEIFEGCRVRLVGP